MRHRLSDPAVCLLLALATFFVYARAISFSFVSYDDPIYVSHNARIAAGLTTENISWAFKTFYFEKWHPLTWLGYLTIGEFFGVTPAPFHACNILLHALNSVLLFLLLKRMTNRSGCSAMVASLFALHPLHIESVAWVSELKDVLSTCLVFLTMHAYVSYTKSRRVIWYIATCGLFAVSLLAKSILVSLPALLLVLDFWPLQRLSWKGVWEKIPLAGLSVASIGVTIVAEASAHTTELRFPLIMRVQNAAVVLGTYMLKTLVPFHLTVFYPHPFIIHKSITAQSIVSTIILLGVTVVAISQRARRPYLIVGWLWFVGTFFPVLGLLQAGEQATADHFTYVPLIGFFILIVWTAAEFKQFRTIAAALGLFGCIVATEIQLGTWRDSTALFMHAIQVTDSNYIALDHLALDQIEHGQPAAAISWAQRSVVIYSHSIYSHTILARAYIEAGRSADAAQAYHDAIQLDPLDSELRNNAGSALVATGRTLDAENQYNEAIHLNPRSAVAHCNLAFLLASEGRLDEAINHWRSALTINPSYSQARAALNQGLRQMQKPHSTGQLQK